MKIVVLTGGVGGARFLLGVKTALGWPAYGEGPAESSDHVTAVVNTADDIFVHGLQVCPDLDSCMYTLSGNADHDRGWGQRDETWTVAAELDQYGADAPWFSLGDKDIATHLVRTQMLAAGRTLTQTTEVLARRRGTGVRLLPMSDDPVTTIVDVDLPLPGNEGNDVSLMATQAESSRVSLHFQEWWVRYRAALPPRRISTQGSRTSYPAPGVVEAIDDADLILLAPSNPVVSIGAILNVPGIPEALRKAQAPIVGVSPIIGGRPVRGHADACLAAINVSCTAEGVGKHYGARSEGGLLDAYLVAPGDGFSFPGVQVKEVPLLMTDPEATGEIVRSCIESASTVAQMSGV
ncbi:2-phospho-L-lactate transferase [Arthrobacter sp. MYb23]|uniref:2-phospho-L-lactate transferase n=1 Tax=unclassified Arthrobacter TaxID=235627 RepID=UPI000CFB9B01|nr:MULTISPECIES: 2-phospho-L-lactate transferase [unclassified Arthrobacter]PRB34162.1 2-phospho-L-lactate transferase [Arthrobacter sp. MYb51]PRB88618.1 2-phospho-L-lactate transferase [Arthrobacter sp. MYb23]